MNESNDLLASTGGAEDGGGLSAEPGADVTKPKLKNAGNDVRKPGSMGRDIETPSLIQHSNSDSEIQNKKLRSTDGNDSGTTEQYIESENITREDIVEDKRVITIIKVTKKNVTIEYRRVTYRWGGLYYFQDNKLSISENVFAFYTGVKD